ncbi:MAG: CHAT domain-containing protein [Saprospiraceae bacterium]
MTPEYRNQNHGQRQTGKGGPPTLYLAFANHLQEPLDNLVVESREVHKILLPREQEGHFNLHREDFAQLDTIAHYLTAFMNQVLIFHYGGHAGSASLLLHDLEANAEGVGTMLAQQKDLALVFLNGCSTKEQVVSLLRKGIPAVIATSAPVNDTRAKDFAIRFYQALSNGYSIGKSFDMAKGYIEALPASSIAFHRGIFQPDATTVDTFHWGLYARDEKALEWTLPEYIKSMPRKAARLGSDMAIVNCNRKEILRQFELGFERAEDSGQSVASFLLLHQPYGESESLVKRLITHLAENRKAVKFPGFDKIDIETVELDGIESRHEAEHFVRKAFNRQLGANKLRYLNEFIKQMGAGELPPFSNAGYIPLAFNIKFRAAAWPTLVNPLLEWLFADFLKPDADMPPKQMFVCFFILEPLRQNKGGTTGSSSFLEKLMGKTKTGPTPDDELYRQMMESLLRSSAQIPVIALPKLTKVYRQDLDDWYRPYEPNEAHRDILVGQLIEKLPKSTEGWDMSHVEIQLRHIVEAHRNNERRI